MCNNEEIKKLKDDTSFQLSIMQLYGYKMQVQHKEVVFL